MKKASLALCSIILLVCLLAACFASASATRLGVDFRDSIFESVSENGQVNFDELADFEWDRLTIVSAYVPLDNMLEEEGLRWSNPDRTNEHNDGCLLLLFSYENQVVAFIQNGMCHRFFSQTTGTADNRAGPWASFDRNETMFIIDNTIV